MSAVQPNLHAVPAYGFASGVAHATGPDGGPLCGTKAKRLRATSRKVTCEKCRAKLGEVIVANPVSLRPDSLLSAKDQRTMAPSQQTAKLVRIGRRALAHGDWMRECNDHAAANAAYAKAAKAAAELLTIPGNRERAEGRHLRVVR